MFERGYKTWCERYSTEARAVLGVAASAPLDMRALAEHLKVRIWTPHDVPDLPADTIDVLLRNDGETPSCWSAVTLVVGSTTLVVLNSSHSPARQASDLAHELAHRIRGHAAKDANVSDDGLLLLSSYPRELEEEADWLAGCLLLPREALLYIKRSGMTPEEAQLTYGVSKSMLNYRNAKTGVAKQVSSVA